MHTDYSELAMRCERGWSKAKQAGDTRKARNWRRAWRKAMRSLRQQTGTKYTCSCGLCLYPR